MVLYILDTTLDKSTIELIFIQRIWSGSGTQKTKIEFE